MIEPFRMFIAGEWIDKRPDSIAVTDPATEEILGQLPVATGDDLDRALTAAAEGFKAWSATGVRHRSAVVARVATVLRERKDAIARALTLEQGKPYPEALDEVEDAAGWFQWYAEEAKRVCGRILPSLDPGQELLVVKEPVGPVAVFTPWNFPAAEPSAHIAAALAAGCSVIVKASEETPGTCAAIVAACREAGVPDGVINLVYGVPARISEHLIAADPVRKISFTGSIPVGKQLAALAAGRMKRFTMELGGNAPAIVCGDADPARAARLLAAKKFRNAGQVCTAPNRFYVHEKVYGRFVEEIAGIASGLRVGGGLEEGTQMGPLVNARRVAAMERFVDEATAKGAKLHAGGGRPNRKGFFWQPTVFADLPDDASPMREEIFGPIVAIAPFAELDDVVARANATNAGLASYVFAGSLETGRGLARAIKSGMVAVNNITVALAEAPFGGVKESGIGRIGGAEGLEDYFDIKLVTLGAAGA